MQVIGTRSVNTNNAWGFGGWSGTVTRYDNGVITEMGRNSHRHSGTSAHNYVYVNVEDDFNITVTNGNRTVLASLPKDDIYIYQDGSCYRAMVGECKNIDKLFGYTTIDAKLFKIVKI